jgi:hypothetical protein
MTNQLPNRDIDLRPVGGLLFEEETHSYFNADGVKYTGMTTFLKPYFSPFDQEATARYKSIKENLSTKSFNTIKEKVGGWENVHLTYDALMKKNARLAENLETVKLEILQEWEDKVTEGSLEHDRREKEVIENGYVYNDIFFPYADKNILELTDKDCCVIPEIMVWDHERQICGLIDLPLFYYGTIHILDYKTNQKIEKQGFMGKKCTSPITHLQDCNYIKYSLQLEGYLEMACNLTGFKKGDTYIIHTANARYNRNKDRHIKCANVRKEILQLFNLIKL